MLPVVTCLDSHLKARLFSTNKYVKRVQKFVDTFMKEIFNCEDGLPRGVVSNFVEIIFV